MLHMHSLNSHKDARRPDSALAGAAERVARTGLRSLSIIAIFGSAKPPKTRDADERRRGSWPCARLAEILFRAAAHSSKVRGRHPPARSVDAAHRCCTNKRTAAAFADVQSQGKPQFTRIAMTWHNKVVWTEGMFLQPQHFQQHDRFTEYQLRQRLAATLGHGWGFTSRGRRRCRARPRQAEHQLGAGRPARRHGVLDPRQRRRAGGDRHPGRRAQRARRARARRCSGPASSSPTPSRRRRRDGRRATPSPRSRSATATPTCDRDTRDPDRPAEPAPDARARRRRGLRDHRRVPASSSGGPTTSSCSTPSTSRRCCMRRATRSSTATCASSARPAAPARRGAGGAPVAAGPRRRRRDRRLPAAGGGEPLASRCSCSCSSARCCTRRTSTAACLQPGRRPRDLPREAPPAALPGVPARRPAALLPRR